MPGNAIASSRIALLDELGEEHVFWTFIERARSVRQLVKMLFDPEAETQPSAQPFYTWLRLEEGRLERWAAAKTFKAQYLAEDALETAMDATEANVRSSKLKAEYQKWMAGVLDPGTYSPRKKVEVSQEMRPIGEALLAITRNHHENARRGKLGLPFVELELPPGPYEGAESVLEHLRENSRKLGCAPPHAGGSFDLHERFPRDFGKPFWEMTPEELAEAEEQERAEEEAQQSGALEDAE